MDYQFAPTQSSLKITLLRLGAIIAAIILIFLALNHLIGWAQNALSPRAMLGLILLILLAYMILIAVPFVPGIEIAVSLMILYGPKFVAPIYVTTVIGLLLAYLSGRFMPYSWLHKIFSDLRLRKACKLLERIAPLEREERLSLLRDRLPKPFRKLIVDWRYFTLALTMNIPGNALIGGGGGIMMIAGLSRTFSTLGVVLTLLIAVAPIPVLILVFGFEPAALFRSE